MRIDDADAEDYAILEGIPRGIWESCRKAGLEISAVDGEELVSVVPKQGATPEIQEAILDHKPWLLKWLRKEGLVTNRKGSLVRRIQ